MSKWEYVKGLFLIFGIPIISFIMAQVDPFSYWDNGEEEMGLGLWFVAVPYWVVLFFAHKYKSQHDRRAHQLGILIFKHFTKEEKEKVREEFQGNSLEKIHFLEENPELAEEIKL